nr:unnamed protein product [Digitaria exilis]
MLPAGGGADARHHTHHRGAALPRAPPDTTPSSLPQSHEGSRGCTGSGLGAVATAGSSSSSPPTRALFLALTVASCHALAALQLVDATRRGRPPLAVRPAGSSRNGRFKIF